MMTSPISTAVGWTKLDRATTGVTPSIAKTRGADTGLVPPQWRRIASVIIEPFARPPRHLHRPEHAFRMRHQDGETPVRRRQPGDAVRRPVRIVRVALGRLPTIVDKTPADQFFGVVLLFF